MDDNSIKPMADPLSINVCPDPTVPSAIVPVGIEPFPEFNPDENDGDLNRTLDWLDLWNEDGNCTKFESRVLKPGSHPHTGALVSFPGSGNSWLRMLLVGITGVFISSIYPGDDSEFQSKGIVKFHLNLILFEKIGDVLCYSITCSQHKLSDSSQLWMHFIAKDSRLFSGCSTVQFARSAKNKDTR